MFGFQIGQGRGLFDLVDRMRSDDGLLVLLLITALLFIGYLILQLLWKAYRAAIEGRDQEIVRLTKELDRYQSLVFERLLAPDDLALFMDKGWPEDEGSGGSSSHEKMH